MRTKQRWKQHSRQHRCKYQIFGVTASVAPSSTGITSVVTVTFQNDPSDHTFTGVVVFIKGYQGNQSPVQIAHSATSPVQFTVNNTGENLSLSVQAIGNAGRAPIAQVPITSVKLPFSVLGGAGQATQTSANNLSKLPGTLDNIKDGTSYAKPIIGRISAGKPLIDFSEGIHLNKILDNIGDGTTYIRSSLVAGDTIIDNGNFEASSSILPPPGYELYSNVSTLAYDTTTPYSGSQSIKITSPVAGGGGIRPIRHVMCRPGDVFFVSARAKVISGAGTANVSISFRNAAGGGISGADATTSSASFVLLTNTQTAPAGAVFATFEIYASIANTVVEFDEHYVRMVRNLDTEVGDGSSRFAQTAGGLTYRPTTNPLTATDAGANATVSIAAFTMRCTGHTDVSVSSGSITALSYGTLYYIYYDDATLAGGAVTFAATTTKETAINGSGRFFVGSILTPVASGASTVGNNDGGVGAQGGGTSIFLFGASTTVNNEPATFTVTNPSNCFDGDTSTFGKIVKAALTSSSSCNVTVSAQAPTSAPWQSLTLKIKSAVPTNSGTSNTVVVSYSLDNGGTFTNIFSITGTRGVTVDSVALPKSQNLALVRVRMSISSSAAIQACEVDLYEAWVTGVL
jgi:hypothetical protein